MRQEKPSDLLDPDALLKRPGAEKDYSDSQIRQAQARFAAMNEAERDILYHNALLGLPGSAERFTEEQILTALRQYHGVDAEKLKKHEWLS